jgi:hypothetical protein
VAVSREDLKHAVELPRAGDWNSAHAIVQLDETDEMACCLHACLHKFEGDDGNALLASPQRRPHIRGLCRCDGRRPRADVIAHHSPCGFAEEGLTRHLEILGNPCYSQRYFAYFFMRHRKNA